MRFQYDHDLHIHSCLSGCSNDPKQNKENILQYALDKKLHTICVTDHFWDETVDVERIDAYYEHNYAKISQIKPLPQADGVRFLFGCETELSKDLCLGLSKERYDLFDFIVVPTTHLHLVPFTISEADFESTERRAMLWGERLDAVLNMHLPFHKTGIAHLTDCLEKPNELVQTLSKIPLLEAERLFKKARSVGVGIEINLADAMHFVGEAGEYALKIFQIAKDCKCKFYLGSDAHHLNKFDMCPTYFERAIDLLELTEEDKFIPQI